MRRILFREQATSKILSPTQFDSFATQTLRGFQQPQCFRPVGSLLLGRALLLLLLLQLGPPLLGLLLLVERDDLRLGCRLLLGRERRQRRRRLLQLLLP